MSSRLLAAPSAEPRLARARAWLREREPAEEVLVVAHTLDAANELLRQVALEKGAAFGWHRAPFARLAATLAADGLARDDAVPVGALVVQAVMARVVHDAREAGSLGRLAQAGGGPGLVRALADAVTELRLAGIDAAAVAKESPELARVQTAYDAALREAGLADRARVFALAVERARDPAPHAWLDRPTLWLDVPLFWRCEQELVRAVCERAPDVLAVVPGGDESGEAAFRAALSAEAAEDAGEDAATELAQLQRHLFEESAPSGECASGPVTIVSAPGESRECVEIARRIHRLAEEGTQIGRAHV